MPWMTAPAAVASVPYRAIDATDPSVLHSGYYLLLGGGIAAAFGLRMLFRIGWSVNLPKLVAIGAIAGSVLVIAVEAVAYGWINDQITAYSADYGSGFAMGYGLYVGLGAGVVSALGGLMGLIGRR
jgi:hypothetical protein